MEKQITLERIIDAPRERVWQAWTDPKEVAMWWGPQGVTIAECTMDVRIGGKLSIVMLAGKELGPMAGQRWPMQGVFQEISAPERLTFTNQAIDENGTILLDGLTEVTLEDLDGKTKLTVKTGAKGMVPQAEQMLAGMEMGWTMQLDKLVDFMRK